MKTPQIKHSKYFESSPLLNSILGELHVVNVRLNRLNQYSYISITCDVYRGEYEIDHNLQMCGMNHDIISKYHPQFEPILKWHGWSINESMHYAANATYWLGWSGWWDKDLPNLSMFAESVNWGLLPYDRDIPDNWIATNHALLCNHADGIGDIDIHMYCHINRHFAEYLLPYVAEYETVIQTALMDRLPALRDLMLRDLESLYQDYGYDPGTITSLMRTPNF